VLKVYSFFTFAPLDDEQLKHKEHTKGGINVLMQRATRKTSDKGLLCASMLSVVNIALFP
jgi:hypothetical protein